MWSTDAYTFAFGTLMRCCRPPSVAMLLLLPACAVRFAVDSVPEGALVALPGGRTVTTPDEIQLWMSPFREVIARVSAPGYRTLVVDMSRRPFRSRLSHPLRAEREVQFVLTPDHGPSGTWTPEGEDLE